MGSDTAKLSDLGGQTIGDLRRVDIHRRFAFRPEFALLYDREFGLEHQLNSTALRLVGCAFEEDVSTALRLLASEVALPLAQIESDFERFWAEVERANQRSHPVRRSGAPAGWAGVDAPFPLVLEVELTRLCNWHCDFCYNVWKVTESGGLRSRSDTRRESAAHLPLPTVIAVLDEAAANDCLRIRFSGGEPTLHPDFIQIVKEAGWRGFDIELFTNGTRLTSEVAFVLAEHRTRVVLVSVHGLEASHNKLTQNGRAFAHAMGAIDAALGAGMRVVAETLVTTENFDEVPELVERLARKGVESVSLMPYVPTGPKDPRPGVSLSSVADLVETCRQRTPAMPLRVPCSPRHCLSDQPEPVLDRAIFEFDDHCAAGILWASVAYDGRLRHCPHSDVYAGHVADGIAQLWRNSMVPTVRAVLARPDAACVDCAQFGPCQGGCHLGRVNSYSADGAMSPSGPVEVAAVPIVLSPRVRS